MLKRLGYYFFKPLLVLSPTALLIKCLQVTTPAKAEEFTLPGEKNNFFIVALLQNDESGSIEGYKVAEIK